MKKNNADYEMKMFLIFIICISKSGFKSDYSNKSCLKFSSFIRSIIGLAFVPLDRFSEGVRNLFVLAKRLSGRQKKFAVKMIDYVSRVWVNGH